MKQDIENIIDTKHNELFKIDFNLDYNTKLNLQRAILDFLVDEVLKVVVEKIKEEIKNNVAYGNFGFSRMDFKHEGQIAINMNDILQLLSNLSPNKENKNNE